MNSIVLTPAGFDAGDLPPAIIPLVWFEAPAGCCLAEVVSPKSVAFDVVAMVTKSITSEYPIIPPANIPLVDEETFAQSLLATVKSPKSVSLPSE